MTLLTLMMTLGRLEPSLRQAGAHSDARPGDISHTGPAAAGFSVGSLGQSRSEPAMPIPPTISEGATGSNVRWLQYLLVRRTLSYQQIDGVFGPVTKTGVEEFQRGAHLAVDGIVGPATWSALGGGDAEPPTLSQGSHGNVVKKLQKVLNEGRGSFAPSSNPVLALDGDYGPQTATAVKGAQKEGGISADGIVGLQTWALPVHAAGQVIADLCGVKGPG